MRQTVLTVATAFCALAFSASAVCQDPEPGRKPGAGGAGGKFAQRGADRRGGYQAIQAGLTWLKQHQDEDGRWDADAFMKHDAPEDRCDGAGNAIHDVGVTSLALLAFLGDGNTQNTGPYKDAVSKATAWLVAQQDQDNGRIGTAQSVDYIYDHAIATWALCESYGLSADEELAPAAQAAIDYLESHRNPYAVWRYQPRDGDNDTSVTSWCIAACCAARDFRLKVAPNTFKLAAAWLDQVTDPTTGRHGYTKAGERSSRNAGGHIKKFPPEHNEALTGAGLFARYLLGQRPKDQAVMDKAAKLLTRKLPRWSEADGAIDLYAWYWSSLALYQAGGVSWKAWAAPMRQALEQGQAKDGAAAGSWAPHGVWCEVGGRVYSTALATLTLQTHYRFARMIR